MRIQHNITAMNSYRNLGANQTRLNKNLEKLSTGYKVNRAADDAAGLAISEKMRAQISGLEQATKNAKDGMSLIQTAEGALTEVHDMLNRMVTLAEQSANGTYDDTVDRFQLQKEVDALKEEIDRVAESTNYNGIKLLDGSLSGKGNVKGMVTVEGIDATKSVAATTAFSDMGATSGDTQIKKNDKISYTVSWTDKDGKDRSTTVEFTVGAKNGTSVATENDALIASDGTKYDMVASGTNAGKLEGDKLQKALVQELNKDVDFAANFKATTSATTDIATASPAPTDGVDSGFGSQNTGITFTAKVEGTDGSVIEGVSLKWHKYNEDSNTYTAVNGTAANAPYGGSNIVANTRAKDASQELILKNLHILRPGDENETDTTVQDSIFEVGGKKFALYGSSNNTKIQQMKEKVGADVTLIQVTETDEKAKDAKDATKDVSNFKGGGTYVASQQDAKIIAGELSRVTGMNFTFDGDKVITGKGTTLQTAKGKTLMLQVGDTSDTFNRVGVNVGDMHVAALGLKDVDISDQDGAADAVSVIKNAVNIVSDTRGGLGALQNRLDHTINNLGVMRENIQSAESLIRDTDVAEEMMTYTKNNILNQSAQAMLAQANQLPQGVLQLLG